MAQAAGFGKLGKDRSSTGSERYRKESAPEHQDSCTMSGEMCSMRLMNHIMDK
ncbi:hypothetical protein [Desulfosporosinus sp. BG]|uniref:hypothetical protein n=1 Tax=Desulfosporosinus sp. BG TaxID=1633135 RepID=UPI00085898A4|nr:hypothetical protein [Desulfosporosinus sp. BG]ODA40827.1 Hydroxymethylpyrimidine phosphate synthase ThiC [Desulfosporosinus sp. BG]